MRFHALADGVTISPTLDRIEAVASVGGLDARGGGRAAGGVRRDQRQSASSTTRAQVQAGQPPDNLIDPEELAPIARADLREALHDGAPGPEAGRGVVAAVLSRR